MGGWEQPRPIEALVAVCGDQDRPGIVRPVQYDEGAHGMMPGLSVETLVEGD